MAEYKYKYCGETFDKPLKLAWHVRSNHKRAKKHEKKATVAVKEVNQITKQLRLLVS
jgi:hypothetical protein